MKPFFLLLAAALLPPLPAAAQEYNVQGVAALEFLPGYRTKRGTHMAALRIRLKEGWKTYWRAPGGNGIAPEFQWSGSKNLQGVAYHWPAPNVYLQDGIRTIGYKNELVLPIEMKAKDAKTPVEIKGKIEFGICSDVCIPATAAFSATLAQNNKAQRSIIQAALAAGPVAARSGGVKSARCAIKPIKGGFRITSVVTLNRPVTATALTVLEYPDRDVWADSGKTVVAGNTLTTQTDLYAFGDAPLALDRSKLRLTLLGGEKTVEIRGCSG